MSVAVVTPVYLPALQRHERVSLRHLRDYLAGYDCYQLSPASLDVKLEGFKLRPFPDEDFKSIHSYSRLMLSRRFYEAFADYDYILIYQLDCVVFRDELDWWCGQGFDYIGAPLFKVKDQPESGFSGACNGGLSLRKVKSFLAVLESKRYMSEHVSLLSDLCHQPFVEVRPLPWFKRLKKRAEVARAVRRGVQAYTAEYTLNEDQFWSGRAGYFDSAFRVAPPETALQFAFETAPAWCYERNRRNLPFGAHAWAKYDQGFWRRYLLPN
jgi:hypothetical protein